MKRAPGTRTDRRELQPVGLIGLGLMGRGIATCLLAHGFEVIAYNRTASRAQESVSHIDSALRELSRRGLLPRTRLRNWRGRFQLAGTLAGLAPCRFVIESVKEDLELKQRLYGELEAAVSKEAVIASNTSSIPITTLQAGRRHPGRFIGMHWGEPAHIMRFLEIIPGRHTSRRTVRRAHALGVRCGKEPGQLKDDVRGFVSNRMFYAMLREAFHLVEAGIADIETVDRSFRNDMGWWALLAGPFRWMDLTGIPAYAAVMEGLNPQLSTATEVPRLMQEMVARGARGTTNTRGFYRYSRKSAREWEKNWVDFTYDMRKVADRYARRGCC